MQDRNFLLFAFLLCLALYGFTFWLGFPGFSLEYDIYNAYKLNKDGWHPVITPYFLQALYALFGRHLYYLFLLNIVPFYLGIFLIIAGFYLRFRSKWVILLLFPTFIGNLYLGNFIQMSYLALGNMCFLLYAMLLFWILKTSASRLPLTNLDSPSLAEGDLGGGVKNPKDSRKSQKLGESKKSLDFASFHSQLINAIAKTIRLSRHENSASLEFSRNDIFSKFFWLSFFTIAFLAILWRHNAIFSVFPAFLVVAYFKAQSAKHYAKLVAKSAIICLFIVIIVPQILIRHVSYPTNHLFLHQIAGACVPANDASCFKDEWYLLRRDFSGFGRDSRMTYSFDDIKTAYLGDILNGDVFKKLCDNWELKGLKSAWIRAILKYPRNFLAHEARMIYALWYQNPRDEKCDKSDPFSCVFSVVKSPETLQADHKSKYIEWYEDIEGAFSEDERRIAFSPLREKIYTILYENLPVLNHIVFVGVSFFIMLISGILLARQMWRESRESQNSKTPLHNLTPPPTPPLKKGRGGLLFIFGLKPTYFFRKKVSKKNLDLGDSSKPCHFKAKAEKSFLPTFSKSRWALATPKELLDSPSPCGRGLGGGVSPKSESQNPTDSRESKSLLPTFSKSRWVWAKSINSLFSPSPCGKGLGGGASQNKLKFQNSTDSRESQNLDESKNPTNSHESSESQKIFRFPQNNNFSLDCHENSASLEFSRNDDEIADCHESTFANSCHDDKNSHESPKSPKTALLLLSFSVSFAGFFSAVFIAGFAPVVWSRYMTPVNFLATSAIICFVAYICAKKDSQK